MLSYSAKLAGPRINRRIQRKTSDVLFGSKCLAVNGCEACIKSPAPPASRAARQKTTHTAQSRAPKARSRET